MNPADIRARWPAAFRAIATRLSVAQLTGLAVACETGDPRLHHGGTTVPSDSHPWCRDFPAERCCALAFTGVVVGMTTVGQLADHFADLLLDSTAGDEWVVTVAWDELPEGEIRADLAALCRELVAERSGP